jgi:hypothetical protein
MKTCQAIKASTKLGQIFDISIIEEHNKKFSAEMSLAAFPAGTEFISAEEALTATIKSINATIAPEKLARIFSQKNEEFITNEKMAEIINQFN